MSNIWLDGFDHGTITKWNPVLGYSTAVKRNGLASGQPGVTICKRPVPAAAAHDTFIWGFALARQGTPSASLWGDVGTINHVTIVFNVDGTVTFRRGNTAGTIIGTIADVVFPDSVFTYISTKCTLSDTAGTLSCQINGLTQLLTPAGGGPPVAELTGLDTKNGGVNTTFDAVGIIGSSGLINRYDDMYLNNGAGSINNDFWPNIRVETLLPDAAGTYSQFTCSTGTNHQALVDEAPMNVSDYNLSDVVGNMDTYNVGALSQQFLQIYGLNVTGYLCKSDAGAREGANMIRTNSTDVVGATRALSTTFTTYTDVYELNPVTGLPWTVTEINALQAGAKVVT